MNTAGDAADQVVRYSLEAGEVALKITGEAAKELAVLLYTVLKEENKTKGKAKLETLIRSGKPLTIFSVKEEDMKKFEKEAKGYGILYYPIPNSNKGDGMYDIMVKEEDAPRINRLVERFKIASVDGVAKVKAEIENGKEKTVPEKERPTPSNEDALADELLGKPIQREENNMSNPSSSKTEKSHPSENTSKKSKKREEGTSRTYSVKPSVRKQLEEIKAARAEESKETIPKQEEKRIQNSKTKPAEHKQMPPKKKKSKER